MIRRVRKKYVAEEAAETVDNPDVLEALGDFAGEDPEHHFFFLI